MFMVGTKIDDEKAKKLYCSGLSCRQVGAMLGTTHTRIIKSLKLSGVPRRDRKESLQKYVRFNTCVICGNVFRPRESWLSTKRATRLTCSDECLKVLVTKVRCKETGHSQAFYQRKRREFYDDICNDCGTTKDVGTHHVDRNMENNSRENLMPLCTKCHAIRHYVEDGIHGRFKRTPVVGREVVNS